MFECRYKVGSQFVEVVHDLIGDHLHSLVFSHPLRSLLHFASQLLVLQRPAYGLDQLLVSVTHRIQLIAIASLCHTNRVVYLGAIRKIPKA